MSKRTGRPVGPHYRGLQRRRCALHSCGRWFKQKTRWHKFCRRDHLNKFHNTKLSRRLSRRKSIR